MLPLILLKKAENGNRTRSSMWQNSSVGESSSTTPVRCRDASLMDNHFSPAAGSCTRIPFFLYAFSTTSGRSVVCFAHVTNAMAQTEGNFEKGEADGVEGARYWRPWLLGSLAEETRLCGALEPQRLVSPALPAAGNGCAE